MHIKKLQKHPQYKYTFYPFTHTSTIVKTPTHYKTHTYTYPHMKLLETEYNGRRRKLAHHQ